MGTRSSTGSTTAIEILEARNGAQGIATYHPTADCAFTGITLQGRDDGGTWITLVTITDPNKPRKDKVTMYREMRITIGGGATGELTWYLEPM